MFGTYPSGSSVATVSEAAAVGSVVAVVTTVDEDAGRNGETHVSIAAGNELGFFALTDNPLFSLLRLAKPLDPALESRFNLTILARDGGSPSKTATDFLPVFVRAAADAPPAFAAASYKAAINEDAPVGAFVATLAARTPSSPRQAGVPSTLRYSFDAGNDLGWFHLDPETGLVRTATELNSSLASTVNLTISARDTGAHVETTSTLLTVSIRNVNDHDPAFLSPLYELAVSEGTPVGSRLTQLAASDEDGGPLSFSLRPDVRGSSRLFDLDPATGVLSLRSPLDREAKALHNLSLEVRDEGGRTGRGSLILRVLDANDNRPLFYPELVLRQATPHTLDLGACSARDPDEGLNGSLKYRLAGAAPDSLRLDPDSGRLSRQEPGLLPVGRHAVGVLAVDGGGLESANNCTLLLFVAEDPVPPPAFAKPLFDFAVMEGAGGGGIGPAIASLSATDPESSSQVEYKVGSSSFWNPFRLSHCLRSRTGTQGRSLASASIRGKSAASDPWTGSAKAPTNFAYALTGTCHPKSHFSSFGGGGAGAVGLWGDARSHNRSGCQRQRAPLPLPLRPGRRGGRGPGAGRARRRRRLPGHGRGPGPGARRSPVLRPPGGRGKRGVPSGP